mmetsp:Transcript_169196/g.543925  ORF Transcript_169196/g.543925 Transcript_169196/m.543925 type:complete len:898 (-) Transcript_169196:84-2777(-)
MSVSTASAADADGDECKLGRIGLALAVLAPLLDSGTLVIIAALDWRSDSRHALGWTPQEPLVLVALQLLWLLCLSLLACTGIGSRPGRCLTLGQVLEVGFPYVFSLAYGMVGVARLVSDEPKGLTNRDDNCFWIVTLVGVLGTTVATYTTLEALPLLRSCARRRSGAREQRRLSQRQGDRLDLELLEDGAIGDEQGNGMGLSLVEVSGAAGASVAAGAGAAAPGATSPLTREEREKREKEQKSKKEKESRRPTVRQLLLLVVPDWPLLILASLLLVLAAVAEAFIPKYISETIAKIIAAEENGTLNQRPFKEPVRNLLLTAFACGVFSSCRGATFIWIGSRASVRLRHTLFDALMRQEIGFFDTTKTGELTSRMTQDCQKVSDQVTLNVNVFLRTLVQTITTLAFMLSLSHPLTLVAFVSVPVIVVISKKYGGVMQKLSENIQQTLADANAVAEEGLGTMSTVRSFAAEGLESERFGEKLEVFGRLVRRQARFYVAYLAATIFLPQSVTALVLFYGGKLVIDGTMKAEGLLPFVFYLQTLNNNFSTLGDFYTNMVQAIGAATRVFELRGREPELPLEPAAGSAAPPQRLEGALRLEGLRFCYPARPEVEVLKGLSLDVPAGQVVSLVGPSGNGKSTIIGLLKRLYKAKEGRVLLDGVDVWDFSHQHYHRVVSIVGQEPVLYARTIRENIVYGLENPLSRSEGGGPDVEPISVMDDEQVFEAARKANAHEFITNMPDGYATEVGERGVQLSGGQKQRIAIARALVRKPKVLLLDEATSALDAESERQVQVAIDSMIAEGSMTVIIIAHRLSTVRNSHKICVVQEGQVVEEGPHDVLVARRGAYFRLVEAQLGGGESSAALAAQAEGGDGAEGAGAARSAVDTPAEGSAEQPDQKEGAG